MNPIVINVVVGVLIWPELVLTIDSIETNVWFFIVAVGEFANITLAIGGDSIYYFEALIFLIEEILFQHVFKNFIIGFEIPAFWRPAQLLLLLGSWV